jgi:flagellar motor switch protein FliN/FliY
MADDDDLLDPAEIEALLNSNLTPGPAAESAAPREGDSPAPGASPPAPAGSSSERLSQSDLDALFQQAVKGPPPSEAADVGGDSLGASEIDSLLNQTGLGKGRPKTSSATEALLDQVEGDLAEALATDTRSPIGRMDQLKGVKEYEFDQFDSGPKNEKLADLDALNEVELDLRIELGRTQLLIEEVLKLREGSVVPLDKLAGDPVDILVNGRLVARGEVLVLNDNFCVRVAEIVSPSF